jgi:large repetitive protein
MKIRLAALTLLVVGLICAPAAVGQVGQDSVVITDAQPTVSCGDVVTHSVVLTKDLVDCPGNGLVIGADNITLDLNGHTIDGLTGASGCYPDCLHGRGIDNTAGHDGVRIINGKVTDFERGVFLVGAQRNVLKNLTVHANATREIFSPVTLIRSDHNTVEDSTMGAGEPALLLFLSDDNTVARNKMAGGISIRQGDGVALVEADDNRLVDNETQADGFAARILRSTGNRLARNTFGGYSGMLLDGVSYTKVTRNTFTGRGGVFLDGQSNRLARNLLQSESGIGVTGDYNRVERNTKTGGSNGINVGPGQGNLVRRNRVDGVNTGIWIRAGAAATRLIANTTNNNTNDGIQVSAPGTRIARNTANNNTNLGINAVPGVIDLGGNRASGNGNPLQCVNVFCQ